MTALTILAAIYLAYISASLFLKYKKWQAKQSQASTDEIMFYQHLDRKRYLSEEGYHLNHYTQTWFHPIYPKFELTDDDLYRLDDMPHIPTEPTFAEILNKEYQDIKPVCPLCDDTGRRVFKNTTPPIDEPCPACQRQ